MNIGEAPLADLEIALQALSSHEEAIRRGDAEAGHGCSTSASSNGPLERVEAAVARIRQHHNAQRQPLTAPPCRTMPPVHQEDDGPDSEDANAASSSDNKENKGHGLMLWLTLQKPQFRQCLRSHISASSAKGSPVPMAAGNHSRWHLADRRQWGRHAGRQLRPNKRHLHSIHLRVTYHPPTDIPDIYLLTPARAWNPSDSHLTGATQQCGRGLRDHRACQQPRLRMHSYCARSQCWSCKGSEHKATTCCLEPQSLCWASTCAEAKAQSLQMDDSCPRPLLPRIASLIPGLWVHHAGPALGRLGLLTERNHTLQHTAPCLMHAAFVNGYPPAVGHAVHAGTCTIGTVPWPGTFAYRGRGQRAHRACQNLSLCTCPWKPVEVSKPCRGLRANVSGRIFHQLPIPCSPSRFNIMAYPSNATHNMPTLVRGSYMHQHVSGLKSMVTSCTPIHCPLELPVQENCSGTIPCLKTRAGGCGAYSAEQHELEPVHILTPVGSICMLQCAARLRGLAHVSHGTQLASCLLSMHQVMMWPYLCFHCMLGQPPLGDEVDTLTTAPPAVSSTWVPKQLDRSLKPQDLAGSNNHNPGSALWLNIPIDAAHSSALRPWGKRCASGLPALGRTRLKVASRSQPPCLEPDLRTQKMAPGWQWALPPSSSESDSEAAPTAPVPPPGPPPPTAPGGPPPPTLGPPLTSAMAVPAASKMPPTAPSIIRPIGKDGPPAPTPVPPALHTEPDDMYISLFSRPVGPLPTRPAGPVASTALGTMPSPPPTAGTGTTTTTATPAPHASPLPTLPMAKAPPPTATSSAPRPHLVGPEGKASALPLSTGMPTAATPAPSTSSSVGPGVSIYALPGAATEGGTTTTAPPPTTTGETTTD